jgi:hypothetical protein
MHSTALTIVAATADRSFGFVSTPRYLVLVIGAVAWGRAFVGYAARKIRWEGWIATHIMGMGLSYVVVLTAFYVDNGPKL